jgi:hypothetical protein
LFPDMGEDDVYTIVGRLKFYEDIHKIFDEIIEEEGTAVMQAYFDWVEELRRYLKMS